MRFHRSTRAIESHCSRTVLMTWPTPRTISRQSKAKKTTQRFENICTSHHVHEHILQNTHTECRSRNTYMAKQTNTRRRRSIAPRRSYRVTSPADGEDGRTVSRQSETTKTTEIRHSYTNRHTNKRMHIQGVDHDGQTWLNMHTHEDEVPSLRAGARVTSPGDGEDGRTVSR